MGDLTLLEIKYREDVGNGYSYVVGWRNGLAIDYIKDGEVFAWERDVPCNSNNLDNITDWHFLTEYVKTQLRERGFLR